MINCYLEPFHFDEFLQAIYDEELVIFVIDGDVACVEPSFGVNSLASGFFIVVVTFHNLRTINAQFAFLMAKIL